LPLRGASLRPASPLRAKRPRHLLTVAGRTPTRAATAALLSPSATPKITAARSARRCSVVPAASHDRNRAWSSLVNSTSAAFITTDCHIR
jgi:hypothetical protein